MILLHLSYVNLNHMYLNDILMPFFAFFIPSYLFNVVAGHIA